MLDEILDGTFGDICVKLKDIREALKSMEKNFETNMDFIEKKFEKYNKRYMTRNAR